MPTTPCHSRPDRESIKINSDILIICGSTSTGKTKYAFELASQFKAVNILSADSRQFYKEIPIISGQDKKEELPSNVTLFGQAILETDSTANISDFKKYANKVIADSLIQNKKLIIVGGSGLYLKAITENLSNVSIAPDLEFRSKAENMSVEVLQNILKDLNTELFNSLNNSDVNNPRRLIRHIEVSRHQSAMHTIVIPAKAGIHQIDTSFSWTGLRKSPENLLQSIKTRVISRIQNGALEEVKKIIKDYPDTSLPIYSTLGVKQILKFLNKEVDEEKLIDEWVIAENNYAKRQNVWFKNQPDIVWYDKDI